MIFLILNSTNIFSCYSWLKRYRNWLVFVLEGEITLEVVLATTLNPDFPLAGLENDFVRVKEL